MTDVAASGHPALHSSVGDLGAGKDRLLARLIAHAVQASADGFLRELLDARS